jgi:hypothetical protein
VVSRGAVLAYSGGTAPALDRLPCYALAGTHPDSVVNGAGLERHIRLHVKEEGRARCYARQRSVERTRRGVAAAARVV